MIADVPFIERFDIGGAYRYSDYTTEDANTKNTFSTDTWHVFANWTPVEDLRLRGQFQRAVRAPNVIELFTPQGTNLPNLTSGRTDSSTRVPARIRPPPRRSAPTPALQRVSTGIFPT